MLTATKGDLRESATETDTAGGVRAVGKGEKSSVRDYGAPW